MTRKTIFRPQKAILYIWLGLLLIPILVGASILAVISSEIGFPKILLILIFASLSLIAAVHTIFYFPSISYELDDRYLLMCSGIFWKVRRSTPLDKITNIDVRQGPLERLFAIGQVWIFTPSTGSLAPEAKLLGVERPHDMKAMIISRSEIAKNSSKVPITDEVGDSSVEITKLLKEMATSLKSIEAALKK